MAKTGIIKVFDKLAPQSLHQAVWETCQSKNWYFGHGSGDKTGLSFWKMDLDGSATIASLWLHAKPVCEQYLGCELKVLRQYANGHTYGLGGGLHRDDPRP